MINDNPWERLIISHTSNGSIIFQKYITLLSLATPYLYISIAAFRKDELFPGQDLAIIIIEFSYVLSMIVNFFTDFTVEGEKVPTRNFNKIAKNYLRGYFLLDFIALLPFQLIHL